MCGRFTLTKPNLEKVEGLANIDLPPLFQGRYNVAPTQPVAAVQSRSPDTVTPSAWGFPLPQGNLVINARMETLREKPLFKNLLESQRCLILADGFYEWKERQPYYFQLEDQSLFAFAGLWRPQSGETDSPPSPGLRRGSSARNEGGPCAGADENECVIITRAAGPDIKPIHERMPVILRPDRWLHWIEGFQLPDDPPRLTLRPVSMRVNKVVNDDPSCIDPAPVQGDLF